LRPWRIGPFAFSENSCAPAATGGISTSWTSITVPAFMSTVATTPSIGRA
jgi:hypothetical protein